MGEKARCVPSNRGTSETRLGGVGAGSLATLLTMTDDAALLDWAGAQEAVGGPLTLASVREGGCVTTNAPAVLLRRSHVPLIEGQQHTVAALSALLGLPPNAVTPGEDGQVVVDLTAADGWLEALSRRDVTPRLIAAHAARYRSEAPRVRLDADTFTWAEAAAVIGEDATLWAVLASAQKASPYGLGSRDDLTTRRDENPLALARRAHAAATVHLDATGSMPFADVTANADPAAGLRVAVVLTCQASADTGRTGRTRPYVEAVGETAHETLRHLERTPATRTNLPALRAARRVLHDALRAAGLASPVPY